MQRYGVTGARLLAVAVLAAGCAIAVRHVILVEASAPERIGQPMRALSLRATDGSPASLAPRPGHAMLINVFTSWCTPCRQELPALARVAPQLRSRGVDVVGIDQAENGERALSVAQMYGLRYPLFVDDDLVTEHVLSAHVIPETILIDGRGVVRSIHVGALDENGFSALADEGSVE